MPIRINKVTKECNVGLQTLVDFLHKKGFSEVEPNPNATITDEQYELVQAEFNKGQQIKGIKIPVQQSSPLRKTKERKQNYRRVHCAAEFLHSLHDSIFAECHF